MTTPAEIAPFLPRQRSMPNEINELSYVLNKSYIEIAQRVNERTIGIFANNFFVVTGESWYLNGQPRKQQSLRQVYSLTAASLPTLNSMIPLGAVSQFVRCWGSYTDGTNWYGIIFGTNQTPTIQINFYLSPDVGTNTWQINFLNGASAPALTQGTLILEWISNVDTNT